MKSGVGDRKLSENPVSYKESRASVTTGVSSKDRGLSCSPGSLSRKKLPLHLLEEKKRFLYLSKAERGKADHGIEGLTSEDKRERSKPDLQAGVLEPCFLQGNGASCCVDHMVEP